MGAGHISKRTVEAIAVGAKDSYLWDDRLAGFGVKVTPNGKRVYLVQYRIGGRNGRTRRVTIGTHGSKTEAQAREEAKKLLGQAQSGNDPASARDRQKNTETFGRAIDRFLDQHVDAKLKSITALEYRRAIRLHVPARLRSRPVGEIERSDIARLHDGLGKIPSQANRLLAILSKFFNWSEAQGIRPLNSNPCRHLQKFREKGRERFLSAEELQRLAASLKRAEETKSASPWIIAAIWLLIFTGARQSEIRTLRWSQVDFEAQQLRLEESKTGRKSIYLNRPASAILTALPRIEGRAIQFMPS